MAGTRVVLTGGECTGKTTLAAVLAERFLTSWVPEAARRYAASTKAALSAATVAPIARLAMRMHDEATDARPSLLFLDTDLISTVVYSRHYYGHCEQWIVDEAAARRAELYLLGAPDLPWTPDGVRDRPTHRAELFEQFSRTLDEFGARKVIVHGTGADRTELAVRAVEALLAERASATRRPSGH